MKAELLACGWTLVMTAGLALPCALFPAMLQTGDGAPLGHTLKGWCLALLVVAAICGLVGVTILVTLSAHT
jgi:hypothetical protein